MQESINNSMELLNKMLKDCSLDADSPNVVNKVTKKAINNVPYINFPGLSKMQCLTIQVLEKDLLLYSSQKNQNKEVVTIFRLDKNIGDKDRVKIIYGDENITKIFSGKEDYNYILTHPEDIVVVLLHNHPNDTPLSVNDFLFFISNPAIKLMTAIENSTGSVYYIARFNKGETNDKKRFSEIIIGLAEDELKNANSFEDKCGIFKRYIKSAVDLWLGESIRKGTVTIDSAENKEVLYHGR